jgi:site-specific recombinase XerD
LQDSFINFILRDGANLFDIMKLSGHSELSTVSNYLNQHFQGDEKELRLVKDQENIKWLIYR